jgi:NADH-quinone oxidoreductase subunit F
MVRGEGTPEDIDTLLDVCDNILGRSFCALGDGAVSPITSGIQYFKHEFLELCDANRRSGGLSGSSVLTQPALAGAH